MLDAWIIEKVKEREPVEERPQIKLPIPDEIACPDKQNELKESDRGVVIIEYGYEDEEA